MVRDFGSLTDMSELLKVKVEGVGVAETAVNRWSKSKQQRRQGFGDGGQTPPSIYASSSADEPLRGMK
jgi:hypothetical protein